MTEIADPEPTIVMVGILNHDGVVMVGPYERRGDSMADEVLFFFYIPLLSKNLPDTMKVQRGEFPWPYMRISYKDLRMDFKGNIYVHKGSISYDKLQEAIRIIAALEGWKRTPKLETVLQYGYIELWAPDEEGTPVLVTGRNYAALIAPKVVT